MEKAADITYQVDYRREASIHIAMAIENLTKAMLGPVSSFTVYEEDIDAIECLTAALKNIHRMP